MLYLSNKFHPSAILFILKNKRNYISWQTSTTSWSMKRPTCNAMNWNKFYPSAVLFTLKNKRNYIFRQTSITPWTMKRPICNAMNRPTRNCGSMHLVRRFYELCKHRVRLRALFLVARFSNENPDRVMKREWPVVSLPFMIDWKANAGSTTRQRTIKIFAIHERADVMADFLSYDRLPLFPALRFSFSRPDGNFHHTPELLRKNKVHLKHRDAVNAEKWPPRSRD